MMKRKIPTAALFILCFFAANSAWAQARVFNFTVPDTITDPLSGFQVEYTLGGSNYGVGAAYAELRFYISASPNGSTGVALLYSTGVHLSGTGWGPYYPPSGKQTRTIQRGSMPASTVSLLENIAAACTPQTWYILAELGWSGYKYDDTVMGTTKQPDFYFIGGTISPAAIQPGGTTNISFDLHTRCPASSGSAVGIYLADANYQLLSFIGAVNIASGAGTSTLPPTAITFSPYMPTGTYHIVLFADEYGSIPESNENNNVGAFQLDVTGSALVAADSGGGQLEPELQLPFDPKTALYKLGSGAPDNYVRKFD
ncbi:hypothetical protein F0U62_02310 [Cystobacter fuscus]|uniref:hypothetical protein n=1 Tax=Cystobacter fuscus TaxID=43 RepID=UPI002B2D8755|nr:hypothetical protein F0U62_02310 [Cystobacter fuscus]